MVPGLKVQELLEMKLSLLQSLDGVVFALYIFCFFFFFSISEALNKLRNFHPRENQQVSLAFQQLHEISHGTRGFKAKNQLYFKN